MTYQIGDMLPPPETTPITLWPIEPRWFVLLPMPQCEAKVQAWLLVRGVESWFPTEIGWRIKAHSHRKEKYVRRIAPGYLFARFEAAPNWPALFYSRHKVRVVSIGDVPAPITDETMAQMQEVPHRLAEMKHRAAEARIIRPHDKARITKGAFEGWTVDVSQVNGGIAKYVVSLFGAEREAEISITHLEKIQPLATKN